MNMLTSPAGLRAPQRQILFRRVRALRNTLTPPRCSQTKTNGRLSGTVVTTEKPSRSR